MAHRGFSAQYPENTMVAFEQARLAGADGFEIDVHLTKDGQIVVIHDEKVDRTTNGTGWIKDLTWEQIKELDSGSWFHSQFASEQIPSLQDVLQYVYRHGLMLNIELKNNIVPYPSLEEKLIQEIIHFGLEDQVYLSTFNHHSLHVLKEIAPTIQSAALYVARMYQPWQYANLIGVEAIHPHYQSITDSDIKQCHEQGLKVRAWTVDDETQMQRLLLAEIDAIVTNVPDRLAQLQAV
ncbi:glycerophosphodiester phosphodiesterase [Hazenella sp. IB182357]|uniref:Glycerophosphodiester phosphodiesterase n=2 Tax=Polycladospora coralii TaxID=2771432 RepID=A0A926N9Y4_9BACL|nr:glycerophosphodiester phosphodiesterase [Polycladospora coralii]MBS7530246.1 glycerophosphodiester phosphodiesterase [Polycladospora coralii]